MPTSRMSRFLLEYSPLLCPKRVTIIISRAWSWRSKFIHRKQAHLVPNYGNNDRRPAILRTKYAALYADRHLTPPADRLSLHANDAKYSGMINRIVDCCEEERHQEDCWDSYARGDRSCHVQTSASLIVFKSLAMS